jgi:hypothetical protein
MRKSVVVRILKQLLIWFYTRKIYEYDHSTHPPHHLQDSRKGRLLPLAHGLWITHEPSYAALVISMAPLAGDEIQCCLPLKELWTTHQQSYSARVVSIAHAGWKTLYRAL